MNQSTQTEITNLPSRKTVIGVSALSLGVAVVILFVAVLPAEFDRDPTGLGKLSGIGQLWSPEEKLVSATAKGMPSARSYVEPFRSDAIEFSLATGDDQNGANELEYKVAMREGATMIYSWSVSGINTPEEFYTEMHGHTVSSGKTMTVAEYRKSAGASDSGMLVAPFAGIHGWYFQNQAAEPLKVTVHLAGFYSLVAKGQPGNEKGLEAREIKP